MYTASDIPGQDGKSKVVHSSRWRILLIAFTLIHALAFLGVMCVHGLKPQLLSAKFFTAFDDIGQVVSPLFAALCGICYVIFGEHPSKIRRAGWLLLSLGCLSWSLGQVTWTYYEVVRSVDVPFPGWPDAGFLTSYPLLVAGVLLLCGNMRGAGRTKLVIDSTVAASAVGVLSWHFLMKRLWTQSGVTTFGKVVGIAYPLGDVAALFAVVIAISTAWNNKGLRRSLYVVCGSILMVSAADSMFTLTTLNNTYQTGSWIDFGWAYGWLLLSYAFLLPLWKGRSVQKTDDAASSHYATLSRPIPALAPYIAVTAAFGVVAADDFHRHGHMQASTFLCGSLLFLMVMVRQGFTLVDNLDLTAKLKSASENLESIVEHRTEQLSEMHRLAKAVNSSLQVEDVEVAAGTHALTAMRSDAVIIALYDIDLFTGNSEINFRYHAGLYDQIHVLQFLQHLPKVEHVQVALLPKRGGGTSASQILQAPLIWQGEQIGVIGVIRWEGVFDEADSRLLEGIGLEVGAALQHARTYTAAIEAADRDWVTGLLNHRAVQQRLQKALGAARPRGEPLSVVLMDVNNFKQFNDTYGHSAGDQVLKQVAKVLEDECDYGEVAARYGGDEFIAKLPGKDREAALIFAQRVRRRLLEQGYQKAAGDRIVPISLSFGIASFPEDGLDRHDLTMIAEANLYEAKQSEEGIKGSTDNQRENRKLQIGESFGILDSMVTAVDNKDRYTRRHSEDVAEYALWIAEEIGMSDETMRVIRIGALLHDVGKIGVPDEVLRKPDKLTDEEYECMKRHPQLGALIVSALPGMEEIVDMVRSHHERWDGRGYPDRLAGEEIPLLGRITAVADTFSAMTTTRPYRKGMEWTVALEEIRRGSGTQFDPVMARAFLAAALLRIVASKKLIEADAAESETDDTIEACPMDAAA